MGYTLLTLTTPLEGKATGQLASGWRAPPVLTGLCLGPGSPEEGAVEGRGWVHVLSAGVAAHTRAVTAPRTSTAPSMDAS